MKCRNAGGRRLQPCRHRLLKLDTQIVEDHQPEQRGSEPLSTRRHMTQTASRDHVVPDARLFPDEADGTCAF